MEKATTALSTASSARSAQPRGASLLGLRRLVVPLGVVLLWELMVRFGYIDAMLVPSPSTVLKTWYTWIAGSSGEGSAFSGTWLTHAWTSTLRVFLGFALAAGLGTVVGIILGTSRLAEELFDPLIQVLRPIPVTAWVPFSVVFFGIHSSSAVFLIAFGAFFPVVVNTAAGAKLTPRILLRAARMLGTREHMLLWRVVLPHALPGILTGWRLGLGLSWVLVIVSEMVAVKSGLGFTLWDAYYYARMDIIVCAMFSIGLLGYVSDMVLVFVDRRLTGWART